MNEDNHRAARLSSESESSNLSPSGPIELVREIGGEVIKGRFSPSAAISDRQSILKPEDDPVSTYLHDTQSSINIHPAQELGLVLDDSDASLRPLRKYMDGNNFDLRGISDFLSSPDLDPNLQCAALQLLEHAAELQSANFTECMPVTFGSVATLVLDSRDIQVHCAALDTMKLFLTCPHATDVIKSMMSLSLVDAISNDLNSPNPLVQLASVELLEAASQSEEILVIFATAISCISGAISSMPTVTQITALKVLEISSGSNIPALVDAVAGTFHFLNNPLSSPETTVQVATLKVLEASAGTKNPQLVRAVKTVLPVVKEIQFSDETDTIRGAARKVLDVSTHNDHLSDAAENKSLDLLPSGIPMLHTEPQTSCSINQEIDMNVDTIDETNVQLDIMIDPRFIPSTAIQKLESFPHGSGGFGDIWKCLMSTPSGTRLVAVKSIRVPQANDRELLSVVDGMIRHEACLWIILSHDRILPFEGIIVEDEFGPLPALVSLWMENGPLSNYLKRSFHQLSIGRQLELIQQVAAGLSYLHENNIVHGGLTGNNILVDSSGDIRLADFGLSMLLTEAEDAMFSPLHPRNVRWMAPEFVVPNLQEKQKTTKAGDIYSFGCVMFQILSGELPYRQIRTMLQVVGAIILGREPFYGVEINMDEAHRLLSSRCLSRDPERRPSILEIATVLNL